MTGAFLKKTIQEILVDWRVVGWSAGRHVDHSCGWRISPWPVRKSLNIAAGKEAGWRVPNPPGANPLVAERAPCRSSQSRVTGGQQPIGNPYRFLSFLLHTWQPLCDPNSHSWGRLFQLPGG